MVAMPDEKRAEALQKGEILARVKRAGMYQSLPFKIVRHATPVGAVPYLTVEKFVDLNELMKIAEEYDLPVQSPNGKIYPRGKRELDFLGL